MLRLSKCTALLGLCTMLSVPAHAIPGPSVSYGANPVWSVGGNLNIYSSDTVTLTVAQTGQELIVTDLALTVSTSQYDCMVVGNVELSDSTGTLGSYSVRGSRYQEGQPDTSIIISMNSGIRIQEGENLVITTANVWQNDCSSSTTRVHYSFSGYYATK
jgi:hypothetical protein